VESASRRLETMERRFNLELASKTRNDAKAGKELGLVARSDLDRAVRSVQIIRSPILVLPPITTGPLSFLHTTRGDPVTSPLQTAGRCFHYGCSRLSGSTARFDVPKSVEYEIFER